MQKLKDLDKKILAGVGLTFAFLILYLVTLPSVPYDVIFDNSYAGFSGAEKNIAVVEDSNNFDTAMILRNQTYCELIISKTIQKKCLSSLENIAAPASLPSSEINDQNNYDAALILGDESSCTLISDTNLREDCLAKVNVIITEAQQINSSSNPIKDDESQTSSTNTETSAQIDASAQNQEDQNNYDTAILLRDITFCNFISESNLKNQCISEIGGTA